VQRRPFKKAGLIEQQADNNRNKGRRRVPDDIPHHRNITDMYNASNQRQYRAQRRTPADA
jgi:hypothetical protein